MAKRPARQPATPTTEPAHVWLPQWAQFLLLAVSIAGILAPAADMRWHFDKTPPPEENRTLAEWPRLTLGLQALQKWPAQYETWVRDHFGYRSSLIAWHSQLMLDVLGISPRADVVLGKDGWLFLGTNKSIDAYRCIFPYQPPGLQQEIANTRARTESLAARGIKFLNVWAPNKENVYPEFLPLWIQKSGQPCRMDQLRDTLRGAGLSFVDLREAEKAARQQAVAYHKTDTHWNAVGAYFGYRQIVTELRKWFPAMPMLERDQVQFVEIPRPGGDMARQLDLEKRYASPQTFEKMPRRCKRVPPSVTRPKGIKLEAFDCPGSKGPRILMFGDSFGNGLIPFLAESSSHFMAVEFGPEMDDEMIAIEKPDVVIDIHVERQMQPDR